jgi:hypothetical protein
MQCNRTRSSGNGMNNTRGQQIICRWQSSAPPAAPGSLSNEGQRCRDGCCSRWGFYMYCVYYHVTFLANSSSWVEFHLVFFYCCCVCTGVTSESLLIDAVEDVTADLPEPTLVISSMTDGTCTFLDRRVGSSHRETADRLGHRSAWQSGHVDQTPAYCEQRSQAQSTVQFPRL